MLLLTMRRTAYSALPLAPPLCCSGVNRWGRGALLTRPMFSMHCMTLSDQKTVKSTVEVNTLELGATTLLVRH
jgi:hypothetical protein